ncbi:hypothetical protein C3K47_01325 [Solitalea longa]|uniref:Phage holin family protein n=1 Tax=Solitalea longa TaxID=2079460 RepID=A0A2S5A9D1_9SPHI|nr:phage holin family protein [Solitalea longa]POY39165.1 hypothetical protein C3K47_01325 [Solitalea longa]
MNEQKELLDTNTLVDNIKDYIALKLRIVTLSVAENTANLLASLITRAAVLLFVIMFCFFASTALALYLGQLLQNQALGFLIVAGIYLFISLIIILIKDKYLEKPLVNTVIRNFFKGSNDDKTDNQN